VSLTDGSTAGCKYDTQSLTLFDLNGSARTELTIRYQGRRCNSRNDVAVRSDRTVYFADIHWQLAGCTPR
jgi:hypothetical protein